MFKVGGYRPSAGEIKCGKFGDKMGKFVKLAANQNDTYLIPEYTPISNQGSVGSCVANATADGFEMIKGLEDPSKVEQVSRLFIYYNARVFQNEVNVDDGCYIHDALRSLTLLGACREETWIYDTSKVFTKPTLEAYREGNDNTIKDFYQIVAEDAERIAQIEAAVRSNHPVIFGTPIGQELADYRGGDHVFDPPSSSIGGHAMLITGVRTNAAGKKEFYVRNSWGTGWGDDGHCWFSANYINWSGFHDLFVPTRMIDFTV